MLYRLGHRPVVFRPSCCGYWQVLSVRQYLPKLCLGLGKTANFRLFRREMDENSPPLLKLIRAL